MPVAAPRFLLPDVANSQRIREKLAQQRFQLILLDLHLPDGLVKSRIPNEGLSAILHDFLKLGNQGKLIGKNHEYEKTPAYFIRGR